MEILIAIIIVFMAAFILVRNLKKSSKGECNCGNCTSHCNKYKNKK